MNVNHGMRLLLMTNSAPDQTHSEPAEGILLVDKTKGHSSFNIVRNLRKRLGVKKIGHAGTLDPFATGVMVMLIGRNYTKLSDQFLNCDKEYVAEVFLGKTTDTYDSDGKEISTSSLIPTLEQINLAIQHFQGEREQIPPMYSAKKVNGKKLYELARKGIEIERLPVKVRLQISLVCYAYPLLQIRVACSKGTYIRSLAFEMGEILGCGAHLKNLRRTRSGVYSIEQCLQEDMLNDPSINLTERFLKSI